MNASVLQYYNYDISNDDLQILVKLDGNPLEYVNKLRYDNIKLILLGLNANPFSLLALNSNLNNENIN